jgi:hypothetical protein
MSQFAFPATLTQGRGLATVTAFNVNAARPVHTANELHPNWEQILEGLTDGDPNVWELFDVVDGIMRRFKSVTERISWNGEDILFDGDPIHSALSDQLLRALEEGNVEDYTALAKFWEKLASNPDAYSQEQAYDWLASHAFQITPEGDVVGYKGMDDRGNGEYQSWHASDVLDKPSGYVNGTPLKPLSKIVQRIGDVVSMPRSEVRNDPSSPCARGLHIGTYKYSGDYGNSRMLVTFNPRDIVSVPKDANGEKLRVCRYRNEGLAGAAPGDTVVLRATDAGYTWAGDVSARV